MTVKQWEQLSPGFRREITRDSVKKPYINREQDLFS